MCKTILSIICFSAFIIQAADQVANSYNAALYGPRAFVDTNLQEIVDSWIKGAPTNGLVCGISFGRLPVKHESPVCYVNIINTTTNNFYGLYLPLEAGIEIEMFNSKGISVNKTIEGKKFGTTWSQDQIKSWADEVSKRRKGGFAIAPISCVSYGSFSIPKMFELKQAGEYTIHLRMRLIQPKLDLSGMRYFSTTWLPEAIAKVEIHPEDIASANSSSNGQTNSPAK